MNENAKKTGHRIVVLHRYRMSNEDINNRPIDKIIEAIPGSTCDGWTVHLPVNFNKEMLEKLDTILTETHLPHNVQDITYICDNPTEGQRAFRLYKYTDAP